MEATLRSRHELLSELCEEPLTKPELVERVSVSRSTVDRAVRELQLHGWVDASNSTYRATEAGRLVLETHRSYRDVLDTIDTATPVLEAVEPGAIGLALLRGATVDVPDPRAPMRALEESTALVRDARSLHGTAPVVFQPFFDHLRESIENGGLACELVLDRTLHESFEPEEREALREIVAADGGALLVTTIEDPYAIWIVDDGWTEHGGVTVYHDGGLAGVIHNDDPRAVEWARERYRDRRADAEVVWDFD